ncbi:MAG: ubiquinone/menaquinone biosynthesis methyltransferase [Candidatus Omnitrophica bacterium]|nr:ubiquinone/menaquinone biosynthesis methyltransferase [Candidatus Omnitrophota bacterium]
MNKNLQELFSSIATRYDALNTILSFNMDKKWRQKTVDGVTIKHDAKILDLCTGTAETAILFAKKYKACEIDAVDFSHPMLSMAKEKITKLGFSERINLVEADVLNLPLTSNYYDAVSISFGLRNVGDNQKTMAQIFTFLKKGGVAFILEFSPAPGNLFGKAANFYVKKILPGIAMMCGGSKQAYGHFASSISTFLAPEEILVLMASAGLKELRHQNLFLGVVNFYSGKK